MSYGYFSKYDREVVRVFQIREHHAKIVKLGRYGRQDKVFTKQLSAMIIDPADCLFIYCTLPDCKKKKKKKNRKMLKQIALEIQ